MAEVGQKAPDFTLASTMGDPGLRRALYRKQGVQRSLKTVYLHRRQTRGNCVQVGRRHPKIQPKNEIFAKLKTLR